MKTKTITQLILMTLMVTFGLSCETESDSPGKYIIGVSNRTNNNIQMQIVLDGISKGVFIVKAGQQGNYSSLCNDLIYAATLDNVYILTGVSAESHKLILKNYNTNFVYFEETFKMEGDGCISQPFGIN